MESPRCKKSSKETLLFLFVPKQLEEEDHSFNPPLKKTKERIKQKLGCKSHSDWWKRKNQNSSSPATLPKLFCQRLRNEKGWKGMPPSLYSLLVAHPMFFQYSSLNSPKIFEYVWVKRERKSDWMRGGGRVGDHFISSFIPLLVAKRNLHFRIKLRVTLSPPFKIHIICTLQWGKKNIFPFFGFW